MDYGLIGEHLGHSFSKEIHEMLGLYQYELKEVSQDDFDQFMKAKDFKAINVTIPYKEKVIPYLDEISPQAKRIKAVNTIVHNNGKLYGYNTDYFGLKDLVESLHIDFTNKKVLILGTGGTSLTATLVCEDLHMNPIIRVSRTKKIDAISYEEALQIHTDAHLIINTTPCGMYPNNEGSIIDVKKFSNLEGVVDVIYNPLQTKLVIDAKNNHIKAVGGLYMLVKQALKASVIFLNQPIPFQEVDIYTKLLQAKQNVVLIGMPSCGKTTIGKVLAQSFNKKFVDVDEEIGKIIQMEIKDFIINKGENAFRDLEESIIKKVAKEQNQVIATGGGSILRSINVNNLKQNGIIYFLDRSLEQLIPTSSRPLSSTKEALEQKYKERYDLYRKSSDVIIQADGDINTVTNLIKEDYLK